LIQLALRPYKHLILEILPTHARQRDFDLSDSDTKYLLSSNKTYYANAVKLKSDRCSFKNLECIAESYLTSQQIKSMLRNKIISITENKIKEFNYKVMHNILPNGALVSKWSSDRKEIVIFVM